jgi:hypothetical protein
LPQFGLGQTPRRVGDHRQKAIKDALLMKAYGRVFQTDCDVQQMNKFGDSLERDWQEFQGRTTGQKLYFD